MTQTAAFDIQGRTVTLPVEVRDADTWAAQFLVPARAAQAIVDPTGLEVAQPVPGRAALSIAFVRYRDTDLDAYNEVAVAFLVRPHDVAGGTWRDRSREFFTGDVGVYIHHLPVNQSFTLEAGQRIWGYPKFMSDIDITDEPGRVTCRLTVDGEHALTLSVRERGPIRLPERSTPTYSFRDDILRVTDWDIRSDDRGARVGGAELTLGPHAMADELRSLGPPKRAAMCTTMRSLHATFVPATAV